MKHNYLARLERWARWMLPLAEAEDVVADYRDIVGDPPRSEEDLLRNLGKPRSVIRPLTQKKPYYTWLAVFALMAACALLLGLSPLPGGNRLWVFLSNRYPCTLNKRLGNVFPPLGMVVALVWFHWKGRKLGKLPRAVPILLTAVAAWIVGVLAVDRFWLNDPMAFAQMWGEEKNFFGWPVYRSIYLLTSVLEWSCFATALLAVFALIKARTGDRRWAAVYILALTAVLLSWQTLSFINMMPPDMADLGWRLSYFRIWAVCSAVGVIGTGVALC